MTGGTRLPCQHQRHGPSRPQYRSFLATSVRTGSRGPTIVVPPAGGRHAHQGRPVTLSSGAGRTITGVAAGVAEDGPCCWIRRAAWNGSSAATCRCAPPETGAPCGQARLSRPRRFTLILCIAGASLRGSRPAWSTHEQALCHRDDQARDEYLLADRDALVGLRPRQRAGLRRGCRGRRCRLQHAIRCISGHRAVRGREAGHADCGRILALEHGDARHI